MFKKQKKEYFSTLKKWTFIPLVQFVEIVIFEKFKKAQRPLVESVLFANTVS